ncbi:MULTISPECIES: DsbA family oxidoreductase [Haloprofundus]|uniref:DsbA family oxidoreductase n=1 Tax=Haloprofundus TaxID=1911573 RepID=UPI000E44CB69|nr:MULTISPECIES: DsbA family protein [Haloprofundus]QCJ46504.1 disulfide bond formation protein DsbA [Haloprofundus sp. MHR1]
MRDIEGSENGVGPPTSVRTDDSLVVYADYVCPFSYLGTEVLSNYLTGRENRGLPSLSVEWRPFDLREPYRDSDGTLRREVDVEESLGAPWSAVEELAGRYGVEMNLSSPRYRTVDSKKAQQLALYVQDEHPDRFGTVHRWLFSALWRDSEDIGDEETLVDIAGAAGIDPASVRSVFDDSAHRRHLEEALEESERENVTGIPSFLYRGRTAQGAVPEESLQTLVESQ